MRFGASRARPDSTTTLYPFQREGVRQIYQFGGRALLGDQMGLGKSIQALSWITRIPKRRPVVIVTPASVKYTWQAEALLHFGLRTTVLEGHCNGEKDLPDDIIILNYDILRSWLPLLLLHQPRCVVLDEIQYCKNRSARRTRYALKLAEKADSVLGLSGTPFTNRPVELWTVLQAVRPDLFPSFQKFAWRYCKPQYTPWGWQYNGATHVEELHRILRQECLIRRLKKDVLPELPDKIRRAVPFLLKSYEEYQEAQTDFLKWLGTISPVRANRAKKSEALTKVGYLLRLVARLKLEWTACWIEEFLENHPDEKIVAFSMNTFVLDHLRERFDRTAVVIDGRVTGRLRQETVKQFHSNRRVRLLLGNWIAAGVGINLQVASNAVALDLPWTPGDLLQGEDRLHRIGQKKKVLIHYLMALNTIEEKQIKILRKKTAILDAVLDGRESSEDLNMFDELLAEMRGQLQDNTMKSRP